MNFTDLKVAVSKQFDKLASGTLLVTEATKDGLWDQYLGAFPEGTNPLFRERTEHDCNCCRQFIRQAGPVVGYVDGKLESIWDIDCPDENYQIVADALSAYVKSFAIKTIFLHDQKSVGTDHSHEISDTGEVMTWKHFHQVLPANVVKRKDQIPSLCGQATTNHKVLERSLSEITSESINVVLDLIQQNSLYRGEEHTTTVSTLATLKRKAAQAPNRDAFLWEESLKLGRASSFRNTVIGTLLVDLSEGTDLETAVKKYEDKVAPANYKRPKALVTPAMIQRAQQEVQDLGIEDSLHRRYSIVTDISINNVLFADRSTQEFMQDSVFDALLAKAPVKLPQMDKVEEMDINKFISDVLPGAQSIELLMDNKLQNNLVSLIAPVHQHSANILKWGNNFSWTYNGEVADSDMRQNVKNAGGNIDGVLRFSIQWNTPDRPHMSDLDAHCRYPGGHISFNRKIHSNVSGSLDVDIMTPNGVAVENIIFTDLNKMPDGDYEFFVNNYHRRSGAGFSAEIEFEGQILEFDYPGVVTRDVAVATIRKQGNKLSVVTDMGGVASVREVWGIQTNKFQEVSMVMNSPNHWDGECTGNKHYFFMLKDCNNPDAGRGFYNEFLSDALRDHRKVFEVLGAQLRAPHSDDQLSGVGFSSTQRNSVVVRVKGSFNRMIKIKF